MRLFADLMAQLNVALTTSKTTMATSITYIFIRDWLLGVLVGFPRCGRLLHAKVAASFISLSRLKHRP